MKRPHFALPEIYGDSLSYYEVLRELIKAMNVIIDNYDTIPEQIADAVKNLDAAQLFSAVLKQLIDTIATDNTKSANAVKVYKKHDLLYATFNETVKLYESIIDFTPGTETELIPGTNIHEVNISELFIELRKLIDDEAQTREQSETTLQQNINAESSAREHGDTTLQQSINAESSAREHGDTTLQQSINAETSAREQADTTLQNAINTETSARSQADTTLQNAVNNEKSAREQADTALQNEINAEKSAREQADTNLQNKIDNGTLKIELLWTNPNINSVFAAQTINIDLSKYKYVYIKTKGYRSSSEDTDNGASVMHFCMVGGYASLIHPINTDINRRKVQITKNSVSFANGYSGTTVANDCVIPLNIYGVK